MTIIRGMVAPGYSPTLERFKELCRDHRRVPVSKVISSDLMTPVGAFLALAKGERHAFLLESVEGGEKIGRYTFLGVRPYMVVEARGERISVRRNGREQKLRGKLFPELERIFTDKEERVASLPDLPPFACGAVGYFAYDAVRQLERLPAKSKDDLGVPDCVLMFFDRVLAFDHVRQQLHIMATADCAKEPPERAYARAGNDIRKIEKKLASWKKPAERRPLASSAAKAKETTPRAKFLKDVAKIKEFISAGDIFQAVLSQRFELTPGVAPLEIYRALRAVNPSPYMYFLQMDGFEVLGSSPEMLVKVKDGRLEYRPIAGTRPRGSDDAEDQRLEGELRADEKERAEHVMLVDLGRNDLGRVSEFGSVKVKQLMSVERYSHVMHLVSSLESKLRPGLTPLAALAACFPAGTLTGAPKVRAMEIIEELEPVRRGVYGGAVLYADFAGNLDSCIAIRTLVMKGKRAYVQAGAGIVADSIAEKEDEECRNKARALLRAVEKARGGG